LILSAAGAIETSALVLARQAWRRSGPVTRAYAQEW
jgi:hypothetical protein